MTEVQELYQVDLGGFLGWGGSLLQQGADGDGMTEHVAGGLGDLMPTAIGCALWVGVGEEYQLQVFQRHQLRDIELRQSAGGHPQIIGKQLGTDDGGLLGLDNRDGLRGVSYLWIEVGRQEVETEETVL